MAKNRNLEKLEYSSELKLASGDGFTPQSLAFVGSNQRIVFCSGTIPNNVLKCTASDYTKLGKKVSTGHANGGTYCKKNGYFYTTAYNNGSNKCEVNVYNTSYNFQFTLTFSHTVNGIAYDPITTQFYVSSSYTTYIYPYEALQKKGKVNTKSKSFTQIFTGDGRAGQDIGGYNGVVMICKSFDGQLNQRSFIDCYNAANGNYIKSYYSDKGELESVAVDGNGHLHVLYAGYRKLCISSNIFNLQGNPASIAGYTASATSDSAVNYINGGQQVVDKAMSFKGEGPERFAEYMGFSASNAWCSEFLWCIIDMCGYSSYVMNGQKWYDGAKLDKWLHNNAETIYYHDGTGSLANAQPGDIVTFSLKSHWTVSHVAFIRKKGTASKVYTIEGNNGNKVKATNWGKSNICGIYRPGYAAIDIGVSSSSDTELVLQVSPEKLYSSDNFKYVADDKEEDTSFTDNIKNLIQNAAYSGTLPSDNPVNIDILQSASLDATRRPSTRVKSSINGSRLPQKLNYVEAPFIEIELGGFVFGTYDNGSYPNYVQSIAVRKTNGSMNEYNINLVHQIAFGDNPNFIEELLSANGYNKIKIKYGDSESGVIFTDVEALITTYSANFNFTNCNISYTIKATSSIISQTSVKQTYTATKDKPSNIIRKLLYESGNSSLLEMFPGMKNKVLVENAGLIPTNDVYVAIDTLTNVNALTYLKYLVSLMTSTVEETTLQNSTYYLTIEDDENNKFGGAYFKITEVRTQTRSVSAINSLIYEVDINYPEPNLIYDFDVTTDYAWAMSYQSANDLEDYNYQIDSAGNIQRYKSSSSMVLTSPNSSNTIMQKNWWTQMTEFPVTATLKVKGLTMGMLILSYIKINCYYYGNKRTTSGLYIVTGQVDSLSANGYNTTLELVRVGSDDEYINIDGRIVT